jgi:hypothetical protein
LLDDLDRNGASELAEANSDGSMPRRLMNGYPLPMDRSQEIDAVMADVYPVLQQVRREDVDAGEIAQLEAPNVESDGEHSSLTSKERLDTLGWALKLDQKDPRLSPLHPAAKLFGELAHIAPYNTRPNDGWEVIVAIGIASQAFDFLTNSAFDLTAIQLRLREGLMRDRMIERTIWGIFGLKIDSATKVGEHSWLLPATVERRSHHLVAKQPTYPLIHAHGYLLSDQVQHGRVGRCDRGLAAADGRRHRRHPGSGAVARDRARGLERSRHRGRRLRRHPRAGCLIEDEERRKIVLGLCEVANERLREMGDPIPAATLNALGAGPADSRFERDVPAAVFREVAARFTKLVQDTPLE